MVSCHAEVMTLTEKLYYASGETRTFTATVLSCAPEDGGYAVTLDRTALFPGGGGQEPDEGTLGGERLVSLREEDETVIHIVPEPLTVGATVSGEVDWNVRFPRMQGHSGEHIFSGTVHRLFGGENVGFHMGAEAMTLDFSVELSAQDVALAELEANRAVWRDLPVNSLLPADEELADMPYRSKKELSGRVRIVEIPGVDMCACCAPHVERTGEIGAIKVLDFMRHRGGTRLTLVCGEAAYGDYAALHRVNARISAALSARRLETDAALERYMRESEAKSAEITRLRREILALKSAALPETEGNLCIFEPELDAVTLRELVNAGVEKCTGICAAFTGADGEYKYIMGSRSVDLRALSREINAAIDGRGGGSPAMIQGTCKAPRERIEAYFARA